MQFHVALLHAATRSVECQYFSKTLPTTCRYFDDDDDDVSHVVPLEGSDVMNIMCNQTP